MVMTRSTREPPIWSAARLVAVLLGAVPKDCYERQVDGGPLRASSCCEDWELSGNPALATALSGSAALTCAPRHLRDYDSDLMVGIWMHRWGSRGVKGSPFKSGRPDWLDADCDQHVGI
jgi:hypothetical protein